MNATFLGGLTFVLVFAGIILVHELGHFISARLFGIEVEEFGFGIPPRIVKLFRWKGTDFTLNWIPLGGFNKFKGEDDPNMVGGLAAVNPWKRIVVLAAGAGMNLLTAVVCYTIYFSQIGIPDLKATAIAAVEAGSPAEQAGLQAGDIVTRAAGIEISTYQQLLEITYQHLDEPLALDILRDGQPMQLAVTPRSDPPEGQGPMGIAIGNPLYPASSWFATVPPSLSAVGRDISSLLALPGRLIAGTVSPEEAQMVGPRTIWNLFQQAVSRDLQSRQPDAGEAAAQPSNYTLIIIMSLTITVGMFNLVPIPALDGGRIFMALTEIVIRRRIPAKYQMAINGFGFMVLVALLGIFYIKDLISPVVINLP